MEVLTEELSTVEFNEINIDRMNIDNLIFESSVYIVIYDKGTIYKGREKSNRESAKYGCFRFDC